MYGSPVTNTMMTLGTIVMSLTLMFLLTSCLVGYNPVKESQRYSRENGAYGEHWRTEDTRLAP